MPSTWLLRACAWLVAAQLVLVVDVTGSPGYVAAVATLVAAAVVAWSLLRPATAGRPGFRYGFAVAGHVVGAMRSFDPDAAGRPRPRAPGV